MMMATFPAAGLFQLDQRLAECRNDLHCRREHGVAAGLLLVITKQVEIKAIGPRGPLFEDLSSNQDERNPRHAVQALIGGCGATFDISAREGKRPPPQTAYGGPPPNEPLPTANLSPR